VRGLLPVERDLVGVVGQPLLVGVVVVVEVCGEVDEEGRIVADGLEPVPAGPGNADELLIVLADDERV